MISSRWNDDDAAAFAGDDLRLRAYSSRLLGQDPSLVLHGGGNTSVKSVVRPVVGAAEEALFVKGSGWDLASIEREGFAPVRLASLLELSRLDRLSDVDMARALADFRLDAAAPMPSVEAITHAILPYRFVDHTHADAVVTLTNTARGEELVREVYGDSVVVIPYVMPGFELARLCAERFPKEAGPRTMGMILLNHGVFTFGDTARESYERMIDLVATAERVVERHVSPPALRPARSSSADRRVATARLRADICAAAGQPMIMSTHDDAAALAFAQHPDVATISQQGPATPDHVLRTKPTPQLGRDVAAYRDAYARYVEQGRARGRAEVTMLDPAPRVVLDPELGMSCAGRTAADARVAEDIYRHTIDIIGRAESLGGYRTLSPQDLFDVEYWDLEQAKLRRAGARPPLEGQIALVTGAASGIGRTCAARFLDQGAAVVGLDIDAAVTEAFGGAAFLGVRCDVTREDDLAAAVDAAVRAYGGIDVVILNAGVFPPAVPVSGLSLEYWRRVMGVNADSAVTLLREAYPMLRLAPGGGRVIVVGSKNVAAPGQGVAAYSASKAALTQLARVIALEWAGDGIRVNVVHPDAVFDTGLWSDDVLASRAAHYGLTVDEYKRRNLLKTEVSSADVAEMCLALAGPAFAKTTGAQVPVDGGNDRVI
ncbi:Rhamnose utilisation protein RhaD, predicted bifunctional aldolase and dehydrogenase [Jiangella sp. DSM 45060]|nr:bifunctional aldolase/short-chain dehydrogenase [Jiangella sp. DSM 45060]SDT46592.1 Rhamnose utilisation protein RhaD, predicted bifunctional aldolase and dehydrogenase [Jiangella sp. DSM 45060]